MKLKRDEIENWITWKREIVFWFLILKSNSESSIIDLTFVGSELIVHRTQGQGWGREQAALKEAFALIGAWLGLNGMP